MSARRAAAAWKHLRRASPRVRVYASGLGPDDVAATASPKVAAGYRAFKLKVGFDSARDVANLAVLRDALGAAATTWSTRTRLDGRRRACAHRRARAVRGPLGRGAAARRRADGHWRALASSCGAARRGREPARRRCLRDAIDAGILAFVQPDVGKWGGMAAV